MVFQREKISQKLRQVFQHKVSSRRGWLLCVYGHFVKRPLSQVGLANCTENVPTIKALLFTSFYEQSWCS